MSIRYGFFDNQLIGVDELKDITKGIQSNGISINAEQFAVSDLNQFYEKVFTTGAVPETETSLKIGVDNSVITVAPGTAYFENGTFITLDAQEELIRISGKNYVYAVSDRDKGEAYIDVYPENKSNDEKEGVYYVPLAEITADGTVMDKRVYAVSALATAPPANASGNYIKEIFIATNPETDSEYSLFINVNPKDYKYLQLVSMGVKTDNDGETSVREDFTFLRFDISDYTNKIPMVCAGYRDNVMEDLAVTAHSENVLLSNQYDHSNGAWICGTNFARAMVGVENISEKGINLKLKIYSDYVLSIDYLTRDLNFEISLIRKDDITDETTVTVE